MPETQAQTTGQTTTIPGNAQGATTPQASTNISVVPSPGTTGAGAVSATPGDWMAGFNDDSKGYVANKGYKSAAELLDSYRNLEKAIGVPPDRLIKLPEDMSTPEARAVWEKLGAPKEAKGYDLAKLTPKETLDPKLTAAFEQAFFEAGVPKGMAEKIVSKWNEFQAQAAGELTESAKQIMAQADTNLKKEWGQAYDQNKNIANDAARRLGLGTDEVKALGQSMGPEKAAKLLYKLGTSTSEDAFVGGSVQPNGGVLAPNQAQQKIAQLKSDPSFTERYLKGEGAAKNEMARLMAQAYPGELGF